MKILFDRRLLMDAVSQLLVAVSTKSTSLVTEGILIEAADNDEFVTMSSFDLEKGVRIKMEAVISEGGSYIISAQKFSQIVRNMPGDTIDMIIDNKNIVTIVSGRSVFRLHALAGADFPSMPELSGDKGFFVREGDLKSLISRVLFAVAVNDPRVELNGVFFEIEDNKIKIIGCDGYKFAMCDKTCELQNKNSGGNNSFRFIVPIKTAAELVRMLGDGEETLLIELARKHIIFKIGEVILFSRMIDHEYIDYRRVIPTESKITAVVSAELLISALERASLVTEDRAAGSVKSYVKLSLFGNRLEITSDSVSGSVKDDMLISHEGDDLEIAFNCRYLLDALRACGEENLLLKLNSPLMSMVFTAAEPKEDDSFLFFVLPVRMKEQV